MGMMLPGMGGQVPGLLPGGGPEQMLPGLAGPQPQEAAVVPRGRQEESPKPIDPALGEQKNLLQEVLDHLRDSQQYLAGLYPKWQRYYRLYRSFTEPKTRPWRANIFVPITFANIEHGLATLLEAWFASTPFIKVLPREGNDYDTARVVESYIDFEIEDMQAFLPIYDSNWEMLTYGLGWGKVFWDWRADRNAVESPSVWNIFPDGTGENVDDAEFIIHRALRSPRYVKRMVDLGSWDLGSVQVEQLAKEGLAFTEQAERVLGLAGQDTRIWKDRIEVLEEWRDDVVLTVLNRRVVVRANRNPFKHGLKPFVRWCDYPVPHEMAGIGEPEIIEKQQEEINDFRNQRLDSLSIILNQVLVASRNAGIDPLSLLFRPGQVIWSDDVSAVKPLVMAGPNLTAGIQEEQQSRFDIQEATANWGYNQGQVPQRRETATTVLALQRAAGIRQVKKVRWNEESAVKRIARMMISNAQQFMPPQRWVRISGENVQIERGQLAGLWDYYPSASTAEPKEAKRASIGQILPLLMKHPRINDEEFLDWILDLYGAGKDKGKFLLNNVEMLMRQAMMAMARGGQNGAGGSPTMIGGIPSALQRNQPDLDGIAEANEAAGPGVLRRFLAAGGGAE